MQRIETLLQKISELSTKGDKANVIDIDLMLDYVKVVYADLLEWRGRVSFTSSLPAMESQPAPIAVKEEPKPQAAPAKEIVLPEAEPETVVAEEPFAATDTIVQEEAIVAEAPVEVAAPVKAPEKIVFVEKDPAPRDIRNNIGINDKYLFMSELFGNDKDAYENALDEINKRKSYNEALDWMHDNVLFTNESEEEGSGTGQLFYDTLSTFFSER